MQAQVSKNELTFIVFNLKRCQKNKKLRHERTVMATTVRLYLALAQPRPELLQMAPNVELSKSKQIVAECLEIANSASFNEFFFGSGPISQFTYLYAGLHYLGT